VDAGGCSKKNMFFSEIFLATSSIILAIILPSGNLLHSYGKSPFLMGESTISMAIFNSYVKLPEGNSKISCFPCHRPSKIIDDDPWIFFFTSTPWTVESRRTERDSTMPCQPPWLVVTGTLV